MELTFWQAISIIDALHRGAAELNELENLLDQLEDEPEFAEILSTNYGMTPDALVEHVEEAIEGIERPKGHSLWFVFIHALHIA